MTAPRRRPEAVAPGTQVMGEVDGKTMLKYTLTQNARGEDVVAFSPEYQIAKKNYLARLALAKVGVESQILQRGFDSYHGEDAPGNLVKLRLFVERFEAKHHTTNLYLWSAWNSTQKSTTAKIVAKEIFLQGFSVRFVTMSELVKALQEESYDPEQYADLLRDCRTVDFLVLDDCFDAKKMSLNKSLYQLPFLDTFLRTRMEVVRKSTCFTSNIDPATIDEPFGVSIRALVERSVQVMPFNDSWNKIDFEKNSVWEE